MCHKTRGPRCPTCQKPAPRHRCRCPAKHAPNPAINVQHDSLPTYAGVMDPPPPTSTPTPVPAQSRCAGRGCGHRRRRCRGPIHLLVSMVIRKVQEKKEREGLAINVSGVRDDGVQESGTVEAVDEKQMEERKARDEEKNEYVTVLTKSVRSMSL